MEKASEVLLAARELIERPERWCQFSLGRDVGGVMSYCAMGALDATEKREIGGAFGYLSDAAKQLAADVPSCPSHTHPILKVNNYGGHGDVMAMFNAAIGLALQAEGPQPDLLPARLDGSVVERANKTGPADGRVRSGGRTA